MAKINITCDICKETYEVNRTNEIPDDVTALMCNWCPVCDDNGKADCDYEERYYYEPIPDKPDPNQIELEVNY